MNHLGAAHQSVPDYRWVDAQAEAMHQAAHPVLVPHAAQRRKQSLLGSPAMQ